MQTEKKQEEKIKVETKVSQINLKPEEKVLLLFEFLIYNDQQPPAKRITPMWPCFVGEASSGKSERAFEIAKSVSKDLGLVIIDQLLPEDIGGIPTPDVKARKTIYTIPEWTDYQLVFFDELDKAKESKLAPILSILTQRMLHNQKLNALFLLAAQLEEGEFNFLERLQMPSEVWKALQRRIILIPTPIELAQERELKRWGIRKFKPVESPITKMLMEFRLPLYYPSVIGFICGFTKWLFSRELEKSNSIEEAKERAKAISLNIFYYYERVEELLNELLYDTEIQEDELEAFYRRIVNNPQNYPLDAVANALTTIPNRLTAREFYRTFGYLYLRFSVDERKKLFENLYSSLSEKLELTTNDEYENARWFIVCWTVLAKKMQNSEEITQIYNTVREYFPEEIEETEEFILGKKGGESNDS